MRKFDYCSLIDKKWDSEILEYVANIHEYKGKQEFYLKCTPEKLEKLVEIAKVQSTESSNAIEGIRTTNTRLKQLVNDKTTPKNRDEEEIAGYRDVLNVIHENYEYINISSNYILQFHKILFSQSSRAIGGKFKNVQNYISGINKNGESYTIFTPLAPYETADAIDNICEQFNKALAIGVEPLILIPIFIHDFLCIHPFLDGNGRMSRLLTTLLLYKCGYKVGKYISLEAKISKNKNLYYDALSMSQNGWHEGMENDIPFIKYLLGIVLSAYRDFEDRFELIEAKLTAQEMVQQAVDGVIGKFTKADIVELCPTLSVKTIEVAIKKLLDNGDIIKNGVGKATFYIKK